MLMTLIAAAISFVIMIVLDLMWFHGMSWFYKDRLASILRLKDGNVDQVLWSGALVYVLLVLGIYFFVLPRTTVGGWRNALFYGAIYGLVVYGVYGTTNHAVLQTWPAEVMIVDTLWGITSCACGSLVFYLLTRVLHPSKISSINL